MSGKIGGVKNLTAAITLCAAAGGWSWLLLNAIPFYLVAVINFGIPLDARQKTAGNND